MDYKNHKSNLLLHAKRYPIKGIPNNTFFEEKLSKYIVEL